MQIVLSVILHIFMPLPTSTTTKMVIITQDKPRPLRLLTYILILPPRIPLKLRKEVSIPGIS